MQIFIVQVFSGVPPFLYSLVKSDASQVHSLGVLIHPSLLLDVQVAVVVYSAFAPLQLVRQLYHVLEKSDFALATTSLGYSNSFCLGSCHMEHLMLIWNPALVSMCFQAQFSVLVLNFKALGPVCFQIWM